jgi:hypothetical protein
MSAGVSNLGSAVELLVELAEQQVGVGVSWGVGSEQQIGVG